MSLSDTGLIVRYYIDEASSGSAPTDVLDVSGVGADFDLLIDYGGGNLAYTEVSGQRGLASSSTTGTQKARKTLVTADKVINALNGSKTATIEVVVDVDTVTANSSRVFGLNDRAGGAGEFILKSNANNIFQVGVQSINYDTPTITHGSRMVMHVVLDTAQAAQNDRIMIAVNGGSLQPVSNTVTIDSTLTVDNALDLTMFNRDNAGSWDRSFIGTLFYAALYSSAFDSTRVTDHYNVLTADDDAVFTSSINVQQPLASLWPILVAG